MNTPFRAHARRMPVNTKGTGAAEAEAERSGNRRKQRRQRAQLTNRKSVV